LIKIAICHYQFETIHPFLDGNGRMGRLIMTLQLIEREILKYPVLYLSSFFNRNRDGYFSALESARINNDLDGWIKFVLEGVISNARNSIKILDNIVILRKKYENKISTLGRREKTALKILMCFFSQPVLEPKTITKKLDVSFNTVNTIILELEKMNIVKEITKASRNRLFVMQDYIDIFKD
jgi:Fic family protein